jgi:hypothetical protein
MTPMNNQQRAHEIRKLEKELENLERAYAALEEGALWAKKVFLVFIAALLALVLWDAVVDFPTGAERAVAPLLIIAFGIWYLERLSWIDVVSGGLGKEHPDEKSGAEVLEAQIAQWKACLAVLRGERSGDAGEVDTGEVAGLIPRTLGYSGNGGVFHHMGSDPFLIMAACIIIAFLGFLLVQKYNNCTERGGKACPLFHEDTGRNCRFPYCAPEPTSTSP